MGKLHSPRHGDEPRARPRFEAVARAAAPGGTHEASLPFATNRTAPVQAESCAAVRETGAAEESGNGVTAGGGIAGIGEAAGVPRPGCSTGGVAASARDTGCVPSGGGALLPSPEAPPDSPGAPERTVLHVDIDAFFAGVGQRRDPRLQGRPVIVGAGVIASCSYEARAFGLRAGMPLSEARRLCPQAVILDGHAQVYRCFAEEIFARCRAIAPEVEAYLDEAYCDLSGTERLHGGLIEKVRELKLDILEATGLSVTCGIGPNRMLAKLIGKTVKPDGLARIGAAEADAFLHDRPIEQLAGVGHAHAKTLRSMNLRTMSALRALSAEVLVALFGANGRLLYEG